MHEHVEPAVGAPVAHAHRVAVADLDELELLEPLDALADGGHVHAELRRQRALGRQPLAGRVPAGEDVGGQRRKTWSGRDVAEAAALFGTVFQCSEQFTP